MDTGVLEKRFEEIYGTKVEHLYFAPGRVNLIGEHIDYNGGRVFPCALSFGTYLAVARRDDRKIAFASMNQTFQVECDQSIFENKPNEWVKYPLGVVKEFSDRGLDPWGFDILYFGDIPGFEDYIRENFGPAELELLLQGRPSSVVLSMTYYPSVNEFRGNKTLQIVIQNYQRGKGETSGKK